MFFEARHHWSGELGREMPFNVYVHSGKPVIVFPSSGEMKTNMAILE